MILLDKRFFVVTLFLHQFFPYEASRLRRDLIDDIFGTPDPAEETTTTEKVVTITPRNPDLTTIASDSCTCMPYYLCKGDGTVNTDGEGIIDIRVRECDSYLEKCCDLSNEGDSSASTTTSTSKPLPKLKGCGYRNPKGIDFQITNTIDHEAQFGEFPWMTAVFTLSASTPTYSCGGSLIHPKVVVTAAHCVKNFKKEKYKIRAGEWDTQTTKEQYQYQERNVRTVKIHPQFNSGSLFNDIALLILDREVELMPHINVACLPSSELIIKNKRCFSSGWGKTNFGQKDKYQVILKKIDLPMVERKQCQDNLRKTRLGRFFKLHNSFVCAGGEKGNDTCTGDGGSPLVCPIEGQEERYFQMGIVAWGIGCGEKDVPGVYVNVGILRKWIDEEMQKVNLNISSYQF